MIGSPEAGGTTPVGPIFDVPLPRNLAFTGRGDVLKELRSRLRARGKTAVVQFQAVRGLGGIGKTQVAVEYAHRHREDYNVVLWLNAETPLDLLNDCAKAAGQLGRAFPADSPGLAITAVRLWLSDHSDWLLIVDNADDPAALGPLLPAEIRGHVLITSRADDFQALGILDPIALPNLPPDEATEFLLRRCARVAASDNERDAARELAREVDGFPLALEQAAAYILETKATFRDYLASYRTRGLGLLEARGPELGRYPRSVVKTWEANFEAVQAESEAAAEVLRIAAFLAPEPIPCELLIAGATDLGPEVEQALAGVQFDPMKVPELLRPLARFSLVRVTDGASSFTIHRMVQEVVKATMDEPTRRRTFERVARAVQQTRHIHAEGLIAELILPHARAIESAVGSEDRADE